MGEPGQADVAYELAWVRSRWPARIAFWVGTSLAAVLLRDVMDTGYVGGRWEITEVRLDGRDIVFRTRDRSAAETRLAALRRAVA